MNSSLFRSTALALMLIPGFAGAQVLAVAPEPTPAPQAADTAAALPTIYVTAEKSSRSLLDTATSTIVLDERDLAARAGFNSVKDVLANTPNIVFIGTGNIAPAVRGVDSTGASQGFDAFVAGSRPRLNWQIDGRPASYNEIIFGDSMLWDVQQVEVLRGAQSTLQGRNAIAGTIATKTKDPTFEPEGALRIGGGNYGQQRMSAVVSGALSESVAARYAADFSRQDGWVRDVQTVDGGGDPTEFESLNLRGKLLIQPMSMPALRSLLTLNHSDHSGPQTESVSRPFGDRSGGGFGYVEPVFQPKTSSIIADTSYEFDPNLSFESLLSGTDLNVKRLTEEGGGIANIDGREYVVEPRLRYSGDGRRSGVAGLYLFKADQDEALDSAGGLKFDDHIRTAAVFGETNWPLTATLDLIAGARYEQEEHRRGGGDTNDQIIRVELDETYRAFLPKLGLAWHPVERSTLGIQILRGYNGGGAGAAYDEDAQVVTNYQYEPEYVWTVELFGRQEFAQGRVRLSANLFYSDYRDMQLAYDLTPADPSDYSFVVDNADEARSYGAEFSADWLLADGFELYGNVGLIKAEITKYPNSGYQGNELPLSPPFSFSGGVNWAGGGWDANLGGRYTQAYYSEIANQPRGKVDPYAVLNAQLGYTWRYVRVYGTVENLLDSDKAMAIYPGTVESDDAANLLAPRTYWVGLQLSW